MLVSEPVLSLHQHSFYTTVPEPGIRHTLEVYERCFCEDLNSTMQSDHESALERSGANGLSCIPTRGIRRSCAGAPFYIST